ncbi:MAG: GNAT family N-acetyltransferase [Burkholderiales bacterium PBB4]|nr:MAG: GNAT family N-acetyltransferase [Burkholderiales bacterium PBB4]
MSLPAHAITVEQLHQLQTADQEALAALLIDTVNGGASVGFMQPLSMERALQFWSRIAREVATGQRALWVVRDGFGIAGTVQLVLDQPDNQPHRADISKLLVHRRARRQGLGDALMRAAQTQARQNAKTLLVLDTASPDAERLYTRLGWQPSGVIPGYALLPDGALCDTTYYYLPLTD